MKALANRYRIYPFAYYQLKCDTRSYFWIILHKLNINKMLHDVLCTFIEFSNLFLYNNEKAKCWQRMEKNVTFDVWNNWKNKQKVDGCLFCAKMCKGSAAENLLRLHEFYNLLWKKVFLDIYLTKNFPLLLWFLISK